MVKAKVVEIGGSQAILLPQEFQVDVNEVYLTKVPEGILVTTRDPWELFHEGAEELPDDFMASGRQQPPQQHRNWDR